MTAGKGEGPKMAKLSPGVKAAGTRKRRAAARKAWHTRKRRAAARKAWHTRRTIYKKSSQRNWTRKSVVKLVFEQIGSGAARTIGRHLELKESTLSTWFSAWK
jgi:hypothetical protein